MKGHPRGRRFSDYVRDYQENWRNSTDPLPERIAKVVKNRAIAAVTLGGCCGHHGEPGC